jgi:hypothetical protein
MSFHYNYDQWLAMTQEQNCPVCRQAPMSGEMIDVVELPHSWLSAEPVLHLHVHLYPRHMDDPFPGQAIDYRQKKRLYTAEAFDAFVGKMRQTIAEYSWAGQALIAENLL